MAGKFRKQNRTFLFKIGAGDTTPVVGTDAIKVENPTGSTNFETDETDEVSGGLDRSARYTGGGSKGMNAVAIVKGAGTAGQAPEAGPLYRVCGVAETLQAAPVTDVLQAGSTVNTLVLAAGDVPADDDFVGMVIRLTSGTYSGYVGVITASRTADDEVDVYPPVGGAAALGDGYTIDACALYAPASAGLEVGCGYLYKHSSVSGEDSILEKLTDGAGECSINWPIRRVGRATFQLQGKLVEPADVTAPGAATYGNAPQPVLKAARTYLGAAGTAIKWSDLTLNFGNEVALDDDPSDQFGYDGAGVTRRRANGRINPQLAHVATRNTFSLIENGTTVPFWLDYGTASGGRVSLYIPAARFVNMTDEENNGFSREGLEFDCTGVDSGFYLCFH